MPAPTNQQVQPVLVSDNTVIGSEKIYEFPTYQMTTDEKGNPVKARVVGSGASVRLTKSQLQQIRDTVTKQYNDQIAQLDAKVAAIDSYESTLIKQ